MEGGKIMQRKKYSRIWIIICLVVTAGLIETCSLAPASPETTTQPAITIGANSTKAHAIKTPAKKAHITKAPATQAPATQAPATQAPTTQAPSTQAPTTHAAVTQAPPTLTKTLPAVVTAAPPTLTSTKSKVITLVFPFIPVATPTNTPFVFIPIFPPTKGWSGFSAIPGGGTTDVSPSAVVYNNQLYLFAKGISDRHIYAYRFDGSSWSGFFGTSTGSANDVGDDGVIYSPDASVWNNKISLFTVNTSGTWLWTIMEKDFDGSAWVGARPVEIGNSTYSTFNATAATAFLGKLYLFFTDSLHHEVYFSTNSGFGWSDLDGIPSTTNLGPAATVFNNTLYLFIINDSDQQIYVSQLTIRTDGNAWSYSPIPNGGTTDAAPAVTVFNNKLYLFAKGIGDKHIYVYTFDGSSWSGFTAIPGGGTTDVSPVVTVYNNKLYLFAKGIDDKQIYVNVYTP